MQEVWKGLQYNGEDFSQWYEISNYGRLRSTRIKKPRKAVSLNKRGYRHYSCTMGTSKIQRIINTHRAVACTFIPTDDLTLTINHIDGDKLNNRVDNLEWCSNADNIRHAFKNGLFSSRKGTANNACVLTEKEVLEIRELYIPRHPEFNGVSLAERYNVHPSTIQAIVHRRKWEWL